MSWAHSASNRSTGPSRRPRSAASLSVSSVCVAGSGPARRMLPSCATQSTRSSRIFHMSPRRPPGRSTLATSGIALAGSTQCQACAATTASTLRSGSGMLSALPARTRAPGTTATNCSRMPSEGSTATTGRPRARSCRVSFPVPAPRSATSCTFSGSSQSMADSGYGGRPRSYAWAARPKEAALISLDSTPASVPQHQYRLVILPRPGADRTERSKEQAAAVP